MGSNKGPCTHVIETNIIHIGLRVYLSDLDFMPHYLWINFNTTRISLGKSSYNSFHTQLIQPDSMTGSIHWTVSVA